MDNVMMANKYINDNLNNVDRKYLISINQIYTMLFPTDTYKCLGCENNCNDCIPGGKNCHYMELTGERD